MIENKETEYKELFLKLAGLLGWTNILIKEEGLHRGVFGSPPSELAKLFGMSEGQRASMPNWLMSNTDAFSLMAEYGIYPRENGYGSIIAGDIVDNHLATTIISQHDDKEMALRYVIVSAVIAKLEENRG